MFRSTDQGTTWREADRGLSGGFPVSGDAGIPLAVGAGRPSRLYVGTVSQGGSAPGGVYTSTDGGRRWRPTGPGLVASSVVVAATAPRCPSHLYAVTGSSEFPGEGSQIYVSADGARTWRTPISGPSGGAAQYGTLRFFTGLAVDAGSGAVAYAGAANGTWRTSDGGMHWAQLPAAPASVDLLFADPGRPGTVYASTPAPSVLTLNTPRQLMVTRDGGATWAPTDLPLPGQVAVTAMVFDPRRPGLLYAATRAPSDDLPVVARVGDGVFASADDGVTWTGLSAGLGDTHVGALALDPRHPATLYAATETHGLYRSTDAGRNWRRAGAGPVPGERRVNVLAVDPATSRLYAATGRGALGGGDWGLWRSGDGGRRWSSVLPNLLHAVVGGIAIDATGTYLDAATYGLGVVRIPMRSGAGPQCRGTRPAMR